jgi:ankyrin repeat protein
MPSRQQKTRSHPRLIAAWRAADVCAADADGCTPLWVACANGQLGVARWLTGLGADAQWADLDGLTPICVACWQVSSE